MKQYRILAVLAIFGLFCSVLAGLPWRPALAAVFGNRPSELLLVVGWSPFTVAALVVGALALHRHLRAPDVVIMVTERPTPLMAKFLEQDRRLERRERLKGELFKLNGEIETFNADMDFDTRHAWANRPGPYGK